MPSGGGWGVRAFIKYQPTAMPATAMMVTGTATAAAGKLLDGWEGLGLGSGRVGRAAASGDLLFW